MVYTASCSIPRCVPPQACIFVAPLFKYSSLGGRFVPAYLFVNHGVRGFGGLTCGFAGVLSKERVSFLGLFLVFLSSKIASKLKCNQWNVPGFQPSVFPGDPYLGLRPRLVYVGPLALDPPQFTPSRPATPGLSRRARAGARSRVRRSAGRSPTSSWPRGFAALRRNRSDSPSRRRT